MTKVSPVSDLSSFLATLEKSGLMSPQEVSKFGDSLSPGADPKSAARELLKQNKLTRWQAGQLLHGYHQLVYGKYKLLDQIGSGEMGRVYLAEHGQLGRRVALKALSRRHTADPTILKAFLDDARRVGALDHPNLCHMFDVNQEADRYFLVMEYVEGQNLQKFVETAGKVPVSQVIEIARQTAEGLGHAHELKVLHGDLKPTNIVIDKHGVVKILDIGLARLTEVTATAGVDDTSESPSLASGIYRPQEQLDGKGIDERSDWYSLGAVICFLLTGKPFQQPDACRSVAQLKKLRPDAPEQLLGLCASLLSETPADRPSSQQDVLTALATAEKAGPVNVSEPAAKAAPPIPRAKSDPGVASKTDSTAGKPKKPPVARPISDTPSGSGEQTVGSSTDAFAFNLNTAGTAAAKKPPVKRASGSAASSATPAVAASAAPESAQPAAKARSSKLPLIIGGAVGGGVLVLALAAGLLFVLLGGGGEEVAQNSAANAVDASADEAGSDASTSEANPAEANPVEANPIEANPVAATPAEANPPPAEAEAPAAVAATEPASSAEGSDSQPAETEPAAEPESPPAEAAPMPEPAAAPAPDPVKPAPPKPAPPTGNPFAGFAKTVSLPKLPAPGGEPTPEMLNPFPLGPCKVDDKALIIVRLMGGETAFKAGKQQFMFDAAEGGTAERDWEIRFGTENDNDLVATVSAKDQQILFQWTPEGVKNPASPYLSNCSMEFSAGSGNHRCALREPVQAEPLVIELDKPNATAKWSLDALPDDSRLEVEIAQFQTGAPKSRVESNTLTADKSTTNVLVGPSDDKLPLGFELKMTATARQIEVKATPKLKLEGLPPGRDRYTKKVVQTIVTTTAGQVQQAELAHMQANQIKDSNQKKKALEQADVLKSQVAKANEMAQALQAAAEAAKTSTVHFRVWYTADDGKVLLLDTGGPQPAGEKK
jgi:eukaryotic-like serine/threonine-protein kinase